MEFDLYIGEDGTVEHVYDDALAGLFDGDGDATVTRASHVEPHPCGGGWVADMSPVGGPALGANDTSIEGIDVPAGARVPWVVLDPFKTRAEALAAERRWLDENHFSKGGDR